MSRPIERLFAIDEMIRSGEYPSIADFMRRFAIQERAAYGDIQYLKRRFHAPIQYSKRQGGYFYTLTGWSLTRTEMPARHATKIPPAQWLWQEITRRFGQEVADELSYDYHQWRVSRTRADARSRYHALPPEEKQRIALRNVATARQRRQENRPSYNERKRTYKRERYQRLSQDPDWRAAQNAKRREKRRIARLPHD